MRKLKILVTGASGFIGQALITKLEDFGHSVVSVSRKLVKSDKNGLVIDVDGSTIWTRALRGCDVVVHLAARTQAQYASDSGVDLPDIYRCENTELTLNLARNAAQANIRRFIFISSIKVNGDNTLEGSVFRADDIPSPQDAYAVSKNEAELGLWKIASETGLEVIVIRPPLVYGPGVKGNFLSLLRAVDKQYPLLLGKVQNRRSLIYLGNLVDVIYLCLSHPNAVGKTFLVSDGEDVSTPELIQRIAEALERKVWLLPFYTSWLKRLGSIMGKRAAVDRLLESLVVDIGLVKQDLGWSPPYTMKAGLDSTSKWYRN